MGPTGANMSLPTSAVRIFSNRPSNAMAPLRICRYLSGLRLSVVLGVFGGIDHLPVLIASTPSMFPQVSIIYRCRLFRPCLSRIARVALRLRACHTRRIVATSRH